MVLLWTSFSYDKILDLFIKTSPSKLIVCTCSSWGWGRFYCVYTL